MLLPTLITSYSAFVSNPLLPSVHTHTHTSSCMTQHSTSLVMLFWFSYIFIHCVHFDVNNFLGVCSVHAFITLSTFSHRISWSFICSHFSTHPIWNFVSVRIRFIAREYFSPCSNDLHSFYETFEIQNQGMQCTIDIYLFIYKNITEKFGFFFCHWLILFQNISVTQPLLSIAIAFVLIQANTFFDIF